MKIDKLFKTNAVYVVYGFFFLSALSQCNSCSHNKENKRLRKEITILQSEIDTLTTTVINNDEMITLIKNTPAWRTLEIEELSDKYKVPINSYKNKEEN